MGLPRVLLNFLRVNSISPEGAPQRQAVGFIFRLLWFSPSVLRFPALILAMGLLNTVLLHQELHNACCGPHLFSVLLVRLTAVSVEAPCCFQHVFLPFFFLVLQ